MLDTPATALALYRHYDLATAEDGHLLLRRRTAPRFQPPRLIQTRELRLGRPFPIPSSRNLLIARIYLRLGTAGSLRKFFFRIPEVTIVTARKTVRIPPEVLEDGVPLNFLPWDLDEARILFAGGRMPTPVDSLTIAGAGSRFFRDPVKVEILDIQNTER